VSALGDNALGTGMTIFKNAQEDKPYLLPQRVDVLSPPHFVFLPFSFVVFSLSFGTLAEY
jgi:hypothetical protein